MHEIQAALTVGTDGRFSRVRQLAQLKPIKLAAPIDLLWFKLPHKPGDPSGQDGLLHLDRGTFLVLFDRFEYWQVGYGFLKGGYKQLRASGIEGLRSAICTLAPWLADHMNTLEDWQGVSLLSVEASRLPQWYRPGLLMLGDAAHVMSPLGGLGINMAVQDAVVAANVLSKPLKKDGHVQIRELAAIQRRRALPTQILQKYQQLINTRIQTRIQSNAGNQRPSAQPSFFVRLVLHIPRLLGKKTQQWIRAYLTAFGLFRPRVR
jgi:2-polyprenyl-6-methoxyphenol hydroxylase-like FAD-dependent oxidoreductase